MESCKLYTQRSPRLFRVQGSMLCSTVLTRLQGLQASRAVLSMVLPPAVSRVTEPTLSLESILENLPTTFQVENLRHRKVKKFTYIFTNQEKIVCVGGSKSPGTGEMARCLKVLAALQRPQVVFPGPTWWSPHGGAQPAGSSTLFWPWWVLHAGGTHTDMQEKAHIT